MEKFKAINKLYFEEQKSLTEIASTINTSISYVSKILKKNEKYTEEKERRKQETLKRKRKIQKQIIYEVRKRNRLLDNSNLKLQHEQAVRELSKNSTIGNNALRKWCGSAYKYNKDKNRYEFNINELNKPADFPLYIKI